MLRSCDDRVRFGERIAISGMVFDEFYVSVQMFREEMRSFARLSIHRLLPMFSWTRQQRQHFLQVEVVTPSLSPQKEFSTATELILFKDVENGDHHRRELSYTSLRDLLATSPPSRHVDLVRAKSREVCVEVGELEDERPAIKNRLVELAARAYLLPTHAQTTPGNQFFSRQWARFTNRNWLHSRHYSSIIPPLQQSGDVSCLHWVDITRAFCSLFKLSHLRPQPVLRL